MKGAPNHKLTRNKVLQIREMLKCGVTGTAIALMFNVDHSLIYRIKNNKRWRFVI